MSEYQKSGGFNVTNSEFCFMKTIESAIFDEFKGNNSALSQ